MMKFLDIHFNFLLRTSFKNLNAQYPIILRVIYRSQRRDIFTGLYCTKEDWNSKESKIFVNDKKSVEMNKNLDLILRKANDVFDELRFAGEQFSIALLRLPLSARFRLLILMKAVPFLSVVAIFLMCYL